jgi:hypothetical protein
MKCIKNSQTGNIIRVSDSQALQMVGSTWQYTAKAEWKAATRRPKQEEIVEAKSPSKENQTIAEKQRNRKKNKK